MHSIAFMQNEMIKCEGEKCKRSRRYELIQARQSVTNASRYPHNLICRLPLIKANDKQFSVEIQLISI